MNKHKMKCDAGPDIDGSHLFENESKHKTFFKFCSKMEPHFRPITYIFIFECPSKSFITRNVKQYHLLSIRATKWRFYDPNNAQANM